jgi:hypothetical protein
VEGTTLSQCGHRAPGRRRKCGGHDSSMRRGGGMMVDQARMAMQWQEAA